MIHKRLKFQDQATMSNLSEDTLATVTSKEKKNTF